MKHIIQATNQDKEEILKLYRSMLYGPAAWDEHYPSMDTIEFDLSRNALYVMKNDADEIIATISIDEDEAVETLDCWSERLIPSSELSRLCVREDMQNQGIAKEMMRYVFEVLKQAGKKGVHILVKTGHERALSSYRALGFQKVGNCHLFEKDFVCMEIEF